MKEFSKIIIVAFSTVWFVACILGSIYVFVYREGFNDWLTFVGAPMSLGIVSYFCKAGFENVKKIKNSINDRL